MDLFDENPREFNFGTCKALLHKAFLSKDQEDWLFDNLITEIDWIQEEIAIPFIGIAKIGQRIWPL
mgnify:CR=1 FL=1